MRSSLNIDNMKIIENKKLKVSSDVKDYFNIIIVCMNQPPKGGCDILEMRKRIKIIDKFDKGGDSLKIEDDEFIYVKQCIDNYKWFFIHKEIDKFVEYISSL